MMCNRRSALKKLICAMLIMTLLDVLLFLVSTCIQLQYKFVWNGLQRQCHYPTTEIHAANVSTPMFVLSALKEEREFPMAYSILVHRDITQLKRLLQAIYRPQNTYCIHLDKKMDHYFLDQVKALEACFDNVIVPDQHIAVFHGQISVLQAEMICMEALLERCKRWRYFINLTGQDWPLKTNLELVRILKALNGVNSIEKVRINRRRIPKDIGLPPHNLHIWKGALHIVAVRAFVEFAVRDQRAKDLLNYLKNTLVPDESFFSTLNHNPSLKAPGGTAKTEGSPQLMRLKHWEGTGQPCHGRYVRTVCIWGMEDLPLITDERQRVLFVNKFILDINADVLDKVEQWFWERTRRVYSNPQKIDVSYYANLSNHD